MNIYNMKRIILSTISILCCTIAWAQHSPSAINNNAPLTDSVELNGKKYITVSFHAKMDKLMYVVEQIKDCGWEFASCQTGQNNSVRICAKRQKESGSPTPVLCIGKFDYSDGTVTSVGVTPYGKKSVLTRTFKNGKLVSEVQDGKDITAKFVVSPNEKNVW